MAHILRQDFRDPSSNGPFDWLSSFVSLVRNSCTPQVFGNIVAKVFVYLGEELRHAGQNVKVQILASETLFKVSDK